MVLPLLYNCAAMGPKAQVSLVQEEVKSKSVSKILIPYTTGIDASGNTGKALLATSIKAYGNRARPTSAIAPLLQSIPGLPKGLEGALFAGYQIEFVKAVEKYRKDQTKPKSISLPEMATFKMTGKLKDIKGLFAAAKNGLGTIPELGTLIQKSDGAQLVDAQEKYKEILPYLSKASVQVMQELKTDHILMTHVVGDEAAWNGKKEVELVTALVNVKTGKLRYFATVKAKKGAVPVPYMAQLGTMSQAIFDTVLEKDPLPSSDKSAMIFQNGTERL